MGCAIDGKILKVLQKKSIWHQSCRNKCNEINAISYKISKKLNKLNKCLLKYLKFIPEIPALISLILRNGTTFETTTFSSLKLTLFIASLPELNPVKRYFPLIYN